MLSCAAAARVQQGIRDCVLQRVTMKFVPLQTEAQSYQLPLQLLQGEGKLAACSASMMCIGMDDVYAQCATCTALPACCVVQPACPKWPACGSWQHGCTPDGLLADPAPPTASILPSLFISRHVCCRSLYSTAWQQLGAAPVGACSFTAPPLARIKEQGVEYSNGKTSFVKTCAALMHHHAS